MKNIYYSECCGKVVTELKTCSRCKASVTKTGRLNTTVNIFLHFVSVFGGDINKATSLNFDSLIPGGAKRSEIIKIAKKWAKNNKGV